MLNDFLQGLGVELGLSVEKVGGKWSIVPSSLKEIIRKGGTRVVFGGTYLGLYKHGRFAPSVWLLQHIKEKTQQWVEVNEKGEWMFICGKHVWNANVVARGSVKKGNFVLVLNHERECLGYGIVNNEFVKNKVVVQNVFDIGNLLRRERKKK